MQSQLTLCLDERLIEQAKEHAHVRGTSVSALVASYFSALGQNGEEPLAPIVWRLRGALLDTSVNRETYREHLREKYED